MPTENRRVAAYLPKNIDEQLDRFKQERGIKGDSSVLIVILEEFFGVSREVAYSGRPQFDTEAFRSDLLSELKSELLSLKSEIKSELLSELKSELPKPSVDQPRQLSLTSDRDVDRQTSDESELPSDSIGGSSKQLSDSEVDRESELNSKPLDGGAIWTGVELSKRLNAGAPQLAAFKNKTAEQLAEWSRKKDPDGIAWMRVGRGQYIPITDDHQGF